MANTYLKRDLSVSETIYKWTWSAWVKRSQLGVHNTLFKSRTDGNNWCQSYFESDDTLFLSSYKNGGYHYHFRTNRKFRDNNAWYHIVLNVDSSQSTAGDRVRIYVNGERETSFQTSTNNLSNGDSVIINCSDSGTGHTIGSWNTSNYFDGYMSHIHYSSGYSYAPTVFGSTDSTTDEWKINTAPTFTLGGNGYTILKDGTTITDQSSNSNDFTLGGGTLTKSEDCPSDVFATWNTLIYSKSTETNGNTTSASGSSGELNAISTLGMTGTGKYYMEFKRVSGDYPMFGILDDKCMRDHTDEDSIGLGKTGTTKSIALRLNDGKTRVNNAVTTCGAAVSNGDIVGVAVDKSTNKIYFSKNGYWANGSGAWSSTTFNASTGATDVSSILTGDTWFFACGTDTGQANNTFSANFGNGFFGTTAISSEGTNASGIGKFEFDVPANYTD